MKTYGKIFRIVAAIALLISAAVLVALPACGGTDFNCTFGQTQGGNDNGTPGDVTEPEEDLSDVPEKPESEINKIIDFSTSGNLHVSGWATANWQNDPELFGCKWSYNNVWVDEDGKLRLEIRDPKKSGDTANYNEYRTGGELRTTAKYGYGYYSVSMKPMKADGVISSFFTYTSDPRWDEIDIEFLGDDTTKVQFNYYTNGKGGHEFVYHLGYDASEEFHTYGFEWLEDSIIWYVDGKPVHKATVEIPAYEQQIMMNLWNIAETGPDDWAGVYKGDLGTAYYEWVGFDAAA